MAAGDSYAGITVPEGDPGQLEGLAQSYAGLAGAVDSAAAVFDAFPSELPMWQGPASVAFAAASDMGGGGARSAGSMLDKQAGSLRVYADDLDAAQRKAERAIDDARDAARRMREAEQMIDDARDRQSEANQRAAGAELVLAATRAVGIDFGGAEAAKAQAEREAVEAADDERRARRLLEQAIERSRGRKAPWRGSRRRSPHRRSPSGWSSRCNNAGRRSRRARCAGRSERRGRWSAARDPLALRPARRRLGGEGVRHARDDPGLHGRDWWLDVRRP